VRELQDLFSAAEILARHPRLAGERLAILTNGGGAGVLAADRLAELDGRLATLSGPAMAALDATLPRTWSHGNPVDIIGDAGPARWMRAFGESLCVYRPPIDTKTVRAIIGTKDNGNSEVVLNFITPHQKWGIHSTYTDNLLMLTLSRGGPIIWISEIDARKAGIEDNDWVEAYNVNGALVARAVVSQRIPEGTTFMYHAQEKMTNVPGSEITAKRGGIHNSVTRITLKPTHMIGGYAQLSYGFNYYGTVGSNRDEFIVMRKMREVDWRDRPLAEKSRYKEAAE
jgi:Molydopterin dinucleotide binding domain